MADAVDEAEIVPPATLATVCATETLEATPPGGENDDIGRFLALADEVNYAGRQPTHAEFERWMEFIRDAFQRDELSSGKSS